jgi:hypothetical protein
MKELLLRLIDAIREPKDRAWLNGYNTAHEEADEFIQGKETWIVQCEGVLQEFFEAATPEVWEKLSPDAREFMRTWA